MKRAALCTIICIGLLYRLLLCAADVPFLNYWVMDDAFYYFKTARVIAATGVWSFDDGLSTTNGFHPFWMLICVAVAKCSALGLVEYLRTMLMISSLLTVAAALLLHKIVQHYASHAWASAAVAVYMLALPFMSISLNGMETQLYMTTLLLCIYASAVRARASVVGLALACAVLARTEAVLLVVIMFVIALGRKRVRDAVIMSVIPFIAFVIFAVISLCHSGHFFQTSGMLKLHHYPWSALTASWANISDSFAAFLPFSNSIAQRSLLVLFVLCCIVSVIRRRELAGYLLFVIALILFYTRSIGYMPLYYLGGPTIITLALICALLPARRPALATLLTVIISIMYAAPLLSRDNAHAAYAQRCVTYRSANMVPSISMYNTAMAVRDALPADAIIGCMDAGCVGYFSEHRVVNLDGVINSQCAVARMNDQLLEYILSSRIEYIVQPRDTTFIFFADEQHARQHLVPQGIIPQTFFYGGTVLYKVERSEQ